MINKRGKTVAPSAASFQAAAANADWGSRTIIIVILADQPGAESWPIAGATFILMYKKPDDAAASTDALKFFDWAYDKGGKAAEDLDYVPLPASVVAQIEKTWAEIMGPDGKPVSQVTFNTTDHREILGCPDSASMRRSGYPAGSAGVPSDDGDRDAAARKPRRPKLRCATARSSASRSATISSAA